MAAFIAEPVVGAALGAVPAPPGYFQAIREICDRYDVLFIADEVMTGFGRTGRAFGIEHWGVVPDLLACAKGLGAGYVPLGAVVATDRVMAPILKAAPEYRRRPHLRRAHAELRRGRGGAAHPARRGG